MGRQLILLSVILIGPVAVLGVVLAVALMGGGGNADMASPSQSALADRRGAEVPHAPTVPVAAIVLDGKADDWADVPVAVSNRPSSTAVYGVRKIKIARDDVDLYVLFELSLGVQERVDRQRNEGGRYWSGAFGHLRFVVDGQHYSVWLPTGTKQEYDVASGQVLSVLPSVTYELVRKKPGTDDYDPVAERDSNDDPGYIAYAGRNIEFRFRLADLKINPNSHVDVTFDEM